jgi:hypothetical protein
MGLTISVSQALLDDASGFPTSGGTDYIAYSVNGTSEWANLARTSVGATGWSAATAADPSVKANASVLTSGLVTTAGGTVTHFAIYSAVTAGTQRTDWQALTASRALSVGDSLQWAVAALQITLT